MSRTPFEGEKLPPIPKPTPVGLHPPDSQEPARLLTAGAGATPCQGVQGQHTCLSSFKIQWTPAESIGRRCGSTRSADGGGLSLSFRIKGLQQRSIGTRLTTTPYANRSELCSIVSCASPVQSMSHPGHRATLASFRAGPFDAVTGHLFYVWAMLLLETCIETWPRDRTRPEWPQQDRCALPLAAPFRVVPSTRVPLEQARHLTQTVWPCHLLVLRSVCVSQACVGAVGRCFDPVCSSTCTGCV